MKRLAVFVLLALMAHTSWAQQGYIVDGEGGGGLFPYVHGGLNYNEKQAGFMGGIGIKTYGKNYAPLGGQIELNYINTTIQGDAGTETGSLVDFNFMAAVTKFRRYLNYHMALGPSIMFNTSGGVGLYNFYPKMEAGVGTGKFLAKVGVNFSLNGNYTNMYNVTLCFYPTRKRAGSENQ